MRTAMRFQVEALEVRLTPGGRGGLGGEVLPVHLPPLQAHVAPPGGEEIPQVRVAHVACGSNTVRAGEEGNALSAGIASAVQKVRE
jgi:hypothetical protein